MEELRRLAEQKLKPGKTVKIEAEHIKLIEGQRMAVTKIQKGTVLALYPYIFTVSIGKRIVSFRYNQLNGEEEERVKA